MTRMHEPFLPWRCSFPRNLLPLGIQEGIWTKVATLQQSLQFYQGQLMMSAL